MKLTIPQQVLDGALSRCLPALETLTTIPILGNFKLDAGADSLTITATDLTVAIRTTVECKVKETGGITLPGAKLRAIVSNFREPEVSIETDATDKATLKCGKSRIKLSGMGSSSFPQMPSPGESVIEIGSAQLARMLTRVLIAVSDQEGRFTLNGALIEATGDELRIVATDGHRLAYAHCENASPKMKFLATKKLIWAFARHKDTEPAKLSQDDNHVFIEAGCTLYTGRKLTGSFPEYSRVLPKNNGRLLTLSRDGFKSCIEQVAPLANQLDAKAKGEEGVTLTFNEGELVAETLGTQGEAYASVDAAGPGPELQMGFAVRYLMEFLGVAVTENVEIHLPPNAKGAIELRPTEPGYRYILMPRHLPQTEKA